ncbi:2-oxoglutarate ferredoxin oxidoreductase subunit delta [Desulfofundulus luciae]|uniref:2-oxoglutarate ferredoxin oxidoreductase subunit delta n=1 Tax=Desulfofundulus luciae TaxID=74702 RepID=A0ABU0B493_9FIRM|nr:4Fe-4S binding protein [Desulfofundulus luciae]MDQ0286268.1 2-oxoglutarate ferredoxin oxidoreductase subunit delta [Desulfofundulus luciae]
MAKVLAAPQAVNIEVRQSWCKGCGICVALCPKGVLVLDDSGKVAVANPGQCIGCGRCEIHCPDFAIGIEVKEQ